MALGLGVVAGCEDDDDNIDEGVATGGTFGTGGSGGIGGSGGSGGTYGTGGTGGTAGTGGAGGATGGTGGATGGTGGTMAGTGGATGGATVTYVQVQPIFRAKCTPCHSAGGIGADHHTLADSNADARKTAEDAVCMGGTVGSCTIIRVRDGSMPLGKGCTGNPAQDASNPACLTQAEQDTLAAWVTGGLQ